MKKAWIFLLFLIALPLCARGEAVISEICAANHCCYFDETWETPDWIELYNPGDVPVPLDGWQLTDSAAGKRALSLDGVTLAPGEYRLIPLAEDCGWGLSAKGETVFLLRDGIIVQQVTFPALEDDTAYALTETEYAVTWLPTPGSGNRLLKSGEAFVPREGLQFSEALTSAPPYKNTGGYDYVELINLGPGMSAEGWRLRLGMAGSKEYVLPRQSMARGDCCGIYCTDYIIQTANTGFPLPAQGAVLSLWTPEGELADFLRLPLQYAGVAYGRAGGDGDWGYLEKQSFGRANGRTQANRLDSPRLSLAGGVYPGASLQVEIAAAPGAEIRYTTDGSAPGRDSFLYTGPLTLTQTTALRAAAFAEGSLPSPDAAATYVLGLEADFAVACLIIDPYYLYDGEGGLLTGSTNGTRNYLFDWEYPAHLEYFDETGQCALSQACGFGIQGDSSRGNRQKGFKLIARKSYGTEDTFAFNPFPHRDFTEYKSLNLRSAGSEGEISIRFRDAMFSSLAEGTHLLYADAQPVLVFLNGQIYGHYNLRERINKYFIAQHTGITDEWERDCIDILSETGDWVRNGSNQDYLALSRFMKNNDLNVPANLQYVLSQMDVQSYFEYVAFMMCTANRDLSNSRFYRVPGGKWTWLLYDLDRAMEKPENSAAFYLYTLDKRHEPEMMTDHVPFAALMQVPEMRARFLQTLSDILYTRFQPEAIGALIDAWHDRVAPIMPYQLDRWTDDNMNYWEYLVRQMRRAAEQRPEYVVRRTVHYFRLTEEEKALYFGK